MARNNTTDAFTLKALTHQADDKELVATKPNYGVTSHLLCLGHNVALEHTTNTTVDGQLARTVHSVSA